LYQSHLEALLHPQISDPVPALEYNDEGDGEAVALQAPFVAAADALVVQQQAISESTCCLVLLSFG